MWTAMTGQMPRLIWVFAGRTCHFVGFAVQRLIAKAVEETSQARATCHAAEEKSVTIFSLIILQHWSFEHSFCNKEKKCLFTATGEYVRRYIFEWLSLWVKPPTNNWVKEMQTSELKDWRIKPVTPTGQHTNHCTTAAPRNCLRRPNWGHLAVFAIATLTLLMVCKKCIIPYSNTFLKDIQ